MQPASPERDHGDRAAAAEEASPRAVHPRDARPRTTAAVTCPHFGPCGGCDLLDVGYAVERRRKEERLRALAAVSYTHLTLPTNREV